MLVVGGKEVLCCTISSAWTKSKLHGGLQWAAAMKILGHTKLNKFLPCVSGVRVVKRNTADWLVAAVDAGRGEASVPQHTIQAAPQTGNTLSRFFFFWPRVASFLRHRLCGLSTLDGEDGILL
jgi:hypothetical protein